MPTRYTITADGLVRIDEDVVVLEASDITDYHDNFNAVQFMSDTNTGEIEWKDGEPNIPITSLDEIGDIIGISWDDLQTKRAAKKLVDDEERRLYLLGPNGDGS